MARRQQRVPTLPEADDPRFEGSAFSHQEIDFLIGEDGESGVLGQLSAVACPPGEDLPEGVNPDQVIPLLNRTYALEAFQDAQRKRTGNKELRTWAGFDKLRAILIQTRDWLATVKELKRRTRNASPELRRAAAAPSLFMWDPDTDVPYLGGAGADAERVLTALGPNGSRVDLHTELQSTGEGTIKSLSGIADFVTGGRVADREQRIAADTPSDFEYVDQGKSSFLRCPICDRTETYNSENSNSKRAAVGRMMRHLNDVRDKKPQHDLLAKRIKSGKNKAHIDPLVAQEAKRAQEALDGDGDEAE